MEIKIASASSPQGLTQQIKVLLEDGWKPMGSHNVTSVHSQNRYRGDQHMDTTYESEYSITMVKETPAVIETPADSSANVHNTDLGITMETAEGCLALKPDGFDGDKDGYDRAIIGLTDNGQLVYSKEWMVRLLLEADATSYESAEDKTDMELMTEEDAWEFLEYNCFNAYVGEQTPLFVNTYETFGY